MAIGAWFLPKNTPQDHLVPICAGLHQVQAVRSITPADALAERPPKPTLKASFPVLVRQFVRKSARPPGSSRRAGGSSPKLPPLRCTVPGSRIRDRPTGTAQNGYLGQKREQSADPTRYNSKATKLVTTKSAALQVRWATTL